MPSIKVDITDASLDAVAYRNWLQENNRHTLGFGGDISKLVHRAAVRELNREQRKLLEMHWISGLSIAEISRITGVHRSTVSRQLNKVSQILYDKLKYAVELHYGRNGRYLLYTALSDDSLCNSTGNRIRTMREAYGLSADTLSRKTGISAQQIEKIEKDGGSMSINQLVNLAAFFNVSTDYIVFGKGGNLAVTERS